MAMNYHDEARIKQERLNRWKQEKERSDAGPSNQYVGDQLDQLASKEKTDRVLTTDPGQFRQIRSVHAWTGTERNRRFYDYSCEGPITAQAWRELRQELNFREKCLPTAMFEKMGRVVPRHEFVPTDPCFMKK
ncbi:uncharacterized protein LOC143289988 isoform X1 [Babylonia areolata]|uniref:uncharacterized protein LOC143289988 isoform X1 n=1 Tax=Babylonia areolata TaxID=304850 RepID=UPI003FD58226